jgi:hypothetical protein
MATPKRRGKAAWGVGNDGWGKTAGGGMVARSFWPWPDNDQDHRAVGPTRVIVEKPNTLNEANDFEKLKGEPDPVYRLVNLPSLGFGLFGKGERLNIRLHFNGKFTVFFRQSTVLAGDDPTRCGPSCA